MAAESDGPILSVRDLTVRFPTEEHTFVYAVDNVSFELHRGEVLAVVGESGCGKSVLASSILGLVPPPGQVVAGSIRFDAEELLGLPQRRLRDVRGRDIAMVFQEPMASLNPVFTIGRQVAEVLRRHEGLSRAAARERVVDLLRQVGIPAPERRVDEYPHQLSGGMAQRVMIAMAIACNPRILVADEPTTALDVTIQAGILRLLLDLRKRHGMAIVLITHDLGVVAQAADQVMVMYAGRKVEAAPASRIFGDPQHPYTIGLLGAVRRLGSPREKGAQPRRLQEIPGMVPTRLAPADHCVFSARCARATERCRAELPLLVPRHEGHVTACFFPGRDAGPLATTINHAFEEVAP